jgi:transketolase
MLSKDNSKKTLQYLVKKIRRDILKVSFEAKACHIGSALSCVEILAVLYSDVLKKEDIFIFSKASGVCAFYTILAEKGIINYSEVPDYLKKYPLPSKEVPGVIWSGGSLGHGLPVAAGMALADRKRKVYCLISDGELQEGTTWETALFANHHKLANLTVIIDRNQFQACGATEDILKLEPLKAKWQTFGWQTQEIDGHNFAKLETALKAKSLKPKVIIAKTSKGKGVSFCENEYSWQYRNLDEELLKQGLKELE